MPSNKISSLLTFSSVLPVAGLMVQSAQAQDPTSLVIPAASMITKGKFQPTMQSLEQYRTPDWFRDAKFGIWAHWGPQSLTGMGDWYARRMYQQGDPAYKEHLKDFGHPSKTGYKDMLPLWKAEKFDPDELMDLYAKAGAKYFVSMAVHHDNFDLWNSQYQPKWNSVNMGPKRDIVGDWEKAAKKYGLRFGVSEHLGASYTWFQTSHGADKTGPLAGVPYDGADPEFQDLYHLPDTALEANWGTKIQSNRRDWFLRIKDLVDKYQPDLLYSDHGFPFPKDAGLPLLAHFYNSNMAQHGGKLEAVYACKENPMGAGLWMHDFERSGSNSIEPNPWQTDTSVADWFYRANDRYRTPDSVMRMLCDIVSKNGNLLLNIVQYPDGSLPPESRLVVEEMAKWMPINGEAIYGTRPWLTYGEGHFFYSPFDESQVKASSQDIRFTTNKSALYAIMLAIPNDGRAVIKALASDSPAISSAPTKVSLLGYNDALKWQQTAQGLEISLPAQFASNYPITFKIEGQKPSAPLSEAQLSKWKNEVLRDSSVYADERGNFNISAKMADLHGQLMSLANYKRITFVSQWRNPDEWISWDRVKVEKPGKYHLSMKFASTEDSAFTVSFAGQTLAANAPSTGDWSNFKTLDLGDVEIERPGYYKLEMRPNADKWKAINVASMQLTSATQ